ncbi:AAA family ATPase [Mycobacterium sp. ITM-2016-00318]|uniref:ATP-binding protein n=1 Tax=Mycobacterium sp. ITM-2016-00318 TaxID=2099693 RepID=UPI00287FE891|nr:adenylate/guanylate cyclase domain-containing protein [Mycobacterium sp. ITM-2016-00318]WNG95466.1 adenylate/guanylate cyclase domain-containing protein [Mycobacterium sp. ITM-2016-00318]
MTATGLTCGSCGAELRSADKFCHECAASVVAAPTPAEYKQVTVLFADVVRSMAIAAALDMERLREIVTDLVERSAAVVRRYGGSVEFTGDGVMAIFGAPVALEDHAFRACLAALAIQQEANRLAGEVARRDGVALRLRVGLNSGRVIAGEIGSGSFGYGAIGEQVGMAQRMESVAPPGGVMLSESTARLVEHAVTLAEPEWVRIKGADEPVRARRLVGIGPREGLVGRAEAPLVGRRQEMAALDAITDQAIVGCGGVVNVVGPPGIGKSRVAREAAAAAAGRGVEVFWTFCESHACEVPFHAVTRLLRAGTGVADLDEPAARARVREQLRDADPQDLLLLDDLLGIADPDVPLPPIDPDARRRRLTALINSVSLARSDPVVYVIEDVHWIDAVSESMFADFLTVIPETPSVVLVTYRPEYQGALTRMHGAQTISLAPLTEDETTRLLDELLGADSSVTAIGALIAGRAVGNPFFVEEMVRELAERGVLEGHRGGYTCRTDTAEVSVPATLQAAIAARIDRLEPGAKQTLNAAAVIGMHFTSELLTALGIDPVVDVLTRVELVDQVRFTPSAEYAFRHPLIRTVAYESQLKVDRAQMHRRVAAAIEQADPASADDNAALIAEHAEAAGEVEVAYGWAMRAGMWSTNRDVTAARVSWERARRIADSLPIDHPSRLQMRIAPCTMLCGSSWRGDYGNISDLFEELRELCTLADDKASLAIGMTGMLGEHFMHARLREASRWASEQMSLIESIADPMLTVALSVVASVVKCETGEFAEVLRWSNRVIELADDDPTKGNLFIGSPLAWALAQRAFARWALGQPGWRDDFDRAVATAQSADPISYAAVVNTLYGAAITCGLLLPDDAAVGEIDQALRAAERSADDVALGIARTGLGVALLHRASAADRQRGLELLEQLRDMCLHEIYYLSILHFGEVYIARERARRGDRAGALPLLRSAVDGMFNMGHLGPFIPGTGVLVETLLARGGEDDVREAQAAIDRLASVRFDDHLAVRDIWLARVQMLMAQAHGDDAAHAHLRDRYRDMAKTLGFEGHIAWGDAMVEGGE